MTTTGYSTVDFDTWLSPAKMVLLLLMAIGGCSGSTGGGIKVVRIIIATRAVLRSITHAFRPSLTVPMRIGGHALGQRAIHSVILFIILMVAIQLIAAIVVSAAEPELGFLTVFSAVQACLYNIGPGFDAVGPTENFHFFQTPTKLFLSLIMILGRLELYAVMVLFMPSLWKRYS
jgi:trk system potassium uptake protein TrkH